MATPQLANVFIQNASDGNARIVLCHTNTTNGTQNGSWNAAPGQTVGPLKVYFESSWVGDYWSAVIQIQGGSTPGFYVSSGVIPGMPYWKECQLGKADANQNITLKVSSSSFSINLPSGGCTCGMVKVGPYAPVTNVFVVMLENRSFDHMFAMSGIPGITAATTSDSNSYSGQTYYVQPSALLSLPTDPGHEFADVLEQLAGPGATYPPGGPYPQITNSGFAANYATSTTEGPAPTQAEIGDVMACFDTKNQLPVIYQLATEFVLCDQWYSSLPGPTWPNRFFLHGASSSGLDDSPTHTQMAEWEAPGEGFEYPHGSIFQALSRAGILYQLYNDSSEQPPNYPSIYSDDPQNGSPLGAVPQASALSGITLLDFNPLFNLANDLQGPYPYAYTFIEPHYGNVTSGTYEGGSSQHPMDDVFGGENLLQHVYSAIHNSPYWATSLLIITYDEHGGLYDSAIPKGAPQPNDNPPYGYNVHGFNFEQYGVRVPAVIVSPLVPAGTVDHTLYDHSSVPKTLEQLFGLTPLTNRDANANGLVHLLSLATPRETPASLSVPRPRLRALKAGLTSEARALIDAQPVPQSGNLMGALAILKKTEIELSGRTAVERAAIQSRFDAIQTRGHARAYAEFVMQKVAAAKGPRRLAARAEPSAPPKENVIEVVLVSGDRLRIPADAATLRMVLSVLSERPQKDRTVG
jgi:phospholipase C